MNTGSKPSGTHLPNGINPSMCMYQVSGTRRVPSPGHCVGTLHRSVPSSSFFSVSPFAQELCNFSDPIGMGFRLGCLMKPFLGGRDWAPRLTGSHPGS